MNPIARWRAMPATRRQKIWRWVSVAGATLIFVTYILKDEVRDRQKDLLEKMRIAQDSYEINSATAVIINEVEQVEFRRRFDKLQGLPAQPNNTIFARPEIISDYETRKEFGQLFEPVRDLKKELGIKGVADDKLAIVERVLAAFRTLDPIVDGVAETPDSRDLTPQEHTAIAEMHQQVFEWSQAVPAFAEAVLQEARSKREHREAFYDILTHVSWITYPVGWLLATLGTLLGKPENPGEFKVE
jgi:hypothetical protein